MKRSAAATRTWARIGLAFGFAASLAANVMSAPDTATGRVITVMYPVSLALALEILFRVEWSRNPLHLLRGLGFLGVALAAAVGSATHIYEVALANGQEPLVAAFLVAAVDGLMIVCTVTLVELGHAPKAKPRPKPERKTVEPVAVTVGDRPMVTSPAVAEAVRLRPHLVDDPQPDPQPVDDKAAEARRLKAEDPDITQAEIAERIGRSVRMVRRYLNEETAA